METLCFTPPREAQRRESDLGRETIETFGFFAISGKCTSFLGPAILALVVTIYDSQRIGMSTIILFLLVGFVLMLKILLQ